MQRTSGELFSSQASTRGRRVRIELTFQVATLTAERSDLAPGADQVQRATGPEPADLLRVERVLEGDLVVLAVRVVQDRLHVLAGGEPHEAGDGDLVVL